MNELSADQIARYRAGARQQEQQHQQQQRERQQRGLEVARQAAQLLKQEFGAQRVRLFGSLLDVGRVRQESDVDLAVDGLDDRRYLEAVAQLLDLSDFSIDLVQVEYAAPRIRQIIDQQGVDL
ncbi:MAG: nucleotidyltransferase domain-containing protein [Elainella sp. Prado103]|jgi:predicted nucleotidyltransferase|nr:nucleotidyltransferase domain-containing protein [Elainella sp. Prado103]